MTRVLIHSAGIVPVYEGLDGPRVLLVEQYGAEGTRWGFPKGKQEPQEELIDTAKREAREETGLSFKKVIEHKSFSVDFELTYKDAIANKTVTYFLGFVDQQSVKFCQAEVKDGGWFSFDEARVRLTFEVDKKLFDQVSSFYFEYKSRGR